MRCYFNLADGDEVLRDEEGAEVADSHHAWTLAVQAIRELAREADAADLDWGRWALDVTDAHGETLLTVPLGDVIANGQGRLH